MSNQSLTERLQGEAHIAIDRDVGTLPPERLEQFKMLSDTLIAHTVQEVLKEVVEELNDYPHSKLYELDTLDSTTFYLDTDIDDLLTKLQDIGHVKEL